MKILETVEVVLRKAKRPLPVAEITRRMISSGLWTSDKARPVASVSSAISFDIKKGNYRFVKVDKGVFSLRKYQYALVSMPNVSKARAVWLKLREGKLSNKVTRRKHAKKKGKMSKELKAQRRYERHLVESQRHGSHTIRGFGTFIMRPINATAARVARRPY